MAATNDFKPQKSTRGEMTDSRETDVPTHSLLIQNENGEFLLSDVQQLMNV